MDDWKLKTTAVVRLERPTNRFVCLLYCIQSSGLLDRFFGFETWTDLHETWNISNGSLCALWQKSGKIAPGVAPKDAKMSVFLVTNTMQTFGHLSCIDLAAFELLSACVQWWQNFRISVPGILQVLKHLIIGYFQGVFVIRLQPKRHNCGQWELFQGIVDILRMCLSWVSFGRFWCYKPTKRINFGEISYFEFTKLQIWMSLRHSPGGDTLYWKRTTLHTLLLSSGTVSRSIGQWLHSSTSLTRGSTLLLSLYCSESTDTLQPV